MRLVLASSSPRRARYLDEIGVAYDKLSPDVDETLLEGESPRRYVRRVAEDKARAGVERRPDAWVLAADTTVVLDGDVLGKPADERDARRMLRRLSGRAHRVLTGIALAAPGGERVASEVSSTRVVFRALAEKDIRWYVATGEPMDKAGAYGAQGKGGLLVERYEGSFSNVVGLPLEKLVALWKRFDLPLPGAR